MLALFIENISFIEICKKYKRKNYKSNYHENIFL